MTFTSPSPTGAPYWVRLHYDPTRAGVNVGLGQRMSPVCGQTKWIGTTDDPEQVVCENCKRWLQRSIRYARVADE